MISCVNIKVAMALDVFSSLWLKSEACHGIENPHLLALRAVKFVRASLKWNHDISKFEIIRKNRDDPDDRAFIVNI
jgi:hypothetical protein